MHLLQAVLMGIVQGLSEFLPISSSGHLVFTSNFYKIHKGLDIAQISSQEVFLDIMLHLGTLIAVIIFFRKEIMDILKAICFAFKNKKFDDMNFKMGMYIILGTFLTILVAVPFKDICAKLVFMPSTVALLLICTGVLLLFSEYCAEKHTEKHPVTLKSSIFIGLAQGLASLPGFSRSGLTIASGMLSGTDRITSAKYSFLLSIPVILGASMIYPAVEIDFAEIITYNWTAIIAGTLVSTIVGYFCIKYFIKFVEKFSLSFFGYYCIIMGVIAFIFFGGVKV